MSAVEERDAVKQAGGEGGRDTWSAASWAKWVGETRKTNEWNKWGKAWSLRVVAALKALKPAQPKRKRDDLPASANSSARQTKLALRASSWAHSDKSGRLNLAVRVWPHTCVCTAHTSNNRYES